MIQRSPLLMILLSAVLLTACTTPRPVETIRQNGDRLYALGDWSGAAEEYELIVQRYPGDWKAQYGLGLARLKLGDANGARNALEVAHTRRPNHNKVADALAEAMYQQGRENELFAFLRERAESTQSVHGYLQLARYAVALNDPDSAQVALETAIEVDDGLTVEPYLQAAAFAQRLGDLDTALRRLRQAYGINPYDERVKQRIRELGEVPGPTIALPPGR
ncbi:MAG: tetratricopeptide repeat protein [Phycisphaerales bacterium]|nr:MAG: tetratricopeptide repeat protein [Phycisphaerales bacterium]